MSRLRDAAELAIKQLALPQPGGQSWRGLSGLPGERNYRSLVGDGMGNSIVAASVLWIARQFPKAPVMLEKRDSAGVLQPVLRHPFLNLIRRPNPSYGGVALWWATITSFLVDGNGYKLKRRNDSKRVVEEWFVPHWMMEPKWPQDGTKYLSHYEYTPGGRLYKVDPEDVVHYRYGLDPDNTRKGRSPLKSLLREVYTDEEAARFTAALLHNLGMPGVILSPGTGQTVSDPEAQAVKAKYQQEFGGDKRGQVMVMTGPTTLETIGFNPQQLDLGRLREIPEERVTSVLGVQAAVVGLGTGLAQTKVGATMSELRQMSWEDGIYPSHMLLADEMEAQELSEFESDLELFEIGFDTTQVPELQDQQDDKAKRWSTLVTGGIAERGEAREAFDLPVRAGDAVFLQPMAIVEVPAPTKAPPGTRGTKETLPAMEGYQASTADIRYLRLLDRSARTFAERMASDLAVAFETLGDRARLAYVTTPKQTFEDEALVTNILERMRVEQYQLNELAPIFTRYTEMVAESTYGIVSDRIGIVVEWNIADPAAQEVLSQGGTRLGLLDLSADTRAALLRAIEEGRVAGEGPVAIANRIRSQVPAGPYVNAGAKYRAEMIARTETLHAQRASTLAAGRKAGFTEYQLFDARIGNTDEECEIRDGRIVDLATAHREMANEHPNGTLSFSPVPRTRASAPLPPVKADLDGEGVRCTSCGSKIAEVAPPGTVITCRKCKTRNEMLVAVTA